MLEDRTGGCKFFWNTRRATDVLLSLLGAWIGAKPVSMMPLSSCKTEEGLDITVAAQIPAEQEGLCNFVLLTGREQQMGIAQGAILPAPLPLRAKSDEEEPHPFPKQMNMVAVFL